MLPLLLLAGSFFVYNANLQRIASGDTAPASLVPFAVWLDGAVTLDRFLPQFKDYPHSIVLKDGHWYSAYPIAAPLLVTPLYAPAALAARAAGWSNAQIALLAAVLEKPAAALIAALSVVTFFLLVRRMTSPKRALLLTLAYAFATETWAVSSQALWQHGPAELCIVAGLLCLLRAGEARERARWLVLAGACAALAAAVRPTNILFVAAIGAALAFDRRKLRDLALFSILPALVGAAVAAYNLRAFGRLGGGYGLDFDAPFWQGFLGLLVSPGRGLLIYTPLAAFSALGAWLWLRKRDLAPAPVYLVAVLFTVSEILLVSKWRVWWGGHTYGPRLLTNLAPCLILLLLPAMDLIARRAVLRVLFGLTLGVSLFLQALGAFCYPNSRWDETPVAVGDRPARLWDWRDSPITRSLAAGPRIGPGPKFYERLRNVISD